MSELRTEREGIAPEYHDEKLLITSIKYTRVVRTLVVASLPSKEVLKSESQPLITGPYDAVSPSVSGPSESKALKVTEALSPVTQKMQSRQYSTNAIVPYTKIIPEPKLEGVCLNRVPSLIKLVRSPNGSYKFEGLETSNLLGYRALNNILNEVKKKQRELESLTFKGYVNSTRLSDYPVLSGYLEAYVKCKKLEKMDPEALLGLSDQEKMNMIDNVLTMNEKRVLVVWLYSLFNLNMYSLLVDILSKIGDPETKDCTDEEKDMIEDLKSYALKFNGNIIPSIRESLRQRGITVSKNIYCGFDTEYKNIEMSENEILSAQ